MMGAKRRAAHKESSLLIKYIDRQFSLFTNSVCVTNMYITVS